MKKRPQIILFCLVILAGLFFGYTQSLPPKAPRHLEESPVSSNQVSKMPGFPLMLSHIKAMASEVHQVGSPGLERSQAYLKNQITEMGYSFVQEDYLLSQEEVLSLLKERADFRNTKENSTLEDVMNRAGLLEGEGLPLSNISVLIDALGTEETIIFMAHTDSVIAGPGAFDDTVSVAALIEGLRALTGQEVKRDLLFLFTDGEEQGLLGAAQFVKNHPEFKDKTSLVINLEARGNAGALILFETTGANLNMIRAYQQAVKTPFSVSIATAVYKTMQNDTDLSRFVMEGYPGINLAAIDGSWVYHTEHDNYDTFSRDSAYHYYETALGLVRHFALEDELNLVAHEDAVHFPFFKGQLVVLPQSLANALAILSIFLLVMIIVLRLIQKSFQFASFIRALGVQVLCLIGTGLFSFGILQAMYAINEKTGAFQQVLFDNLGDVISLALALVFILLTVLLTLKSFRGSQSPVSFSLGLLALPALMALLTAFIFPSASYLFSMPVILGTLAFLPGRRQPWLRIILVYLTSFVTLMLFVPIIHLFYIALGIHAIFIILLLMLLPLGLILGQGLRLQFSSKGLY